MIRHNGRRGMDKICQSPHKSETLPFGDGIIPYCWSYEATGVGDHAILARLVRNQYGSNAMAASVSSEVGGSGHIEVF